MSETLDKDKHQQQILFDETDVKSSLDLEETSTQPILFDNQDWLPEDNTDIDSDEDIIEESKPRWLWRIIFSLFSVLVVVEAVDFFRVGFTESPIIASIYAIILACLAVLAGSTLIREFKGLRQFKQQQKIQTQVRDILNGDGKVSAMDICQNISDKMPCDVTTKQEKKWDDIVHAQYSDAELLQLYSRVVLTDVDQKALAEVAKFSTESLVLIALSPIAIIDMFIMLWRNFRMINKIAGLYGLKLGYWGRIKLVKQVFVNMVYAGASELVTDFGSDMIGADALGKLSGRLAQGLGAGLLTARLGLRTIKLCRPIPFENDAPKLSHVRKEIVIKIKQLMSK
ncbi:YcjF family protein [Colwelliaceae bacterium 6471]